MSDTDVLIEQKEKVIIGDREYMVGELSLIQLVKITKFVAINIFSNAEKLAELTKTADETTDNMDDAMKMVELIDENKLPELLGLILKEEDTNYLTEKVSATHTTQIIAVLCENNDFPQVKKNIERILKATAPKEKKIQ